MVLFSFIFDLCSLTPENFDVKVLFELNETGIERKLSFSPVEPSLFEFVESKSIKMKKFPFVTGLLASKPKISDPLIIS